MDIVFFVNHFLPKVGGVELSVHHTALALARARHAVTIITETQSAAEDPPELGYNIKRFKVKVVRPFTRLLYWQWMWKNRGIFSDADVLHFHDYTTIIHWFFPLLFLVRKPIYGITFHGFEGFPIKFRHHFFRSIAVMFTDVVMGVGAFLQTHYSQRFDSIYIGAPVHELPAHDENARNRFLYVGRFEPDTNILEIVKGLSAVAASMQHRISIRLVGDGSQKGILKAAAHSYCDIELCGVQRDPSREYAKASHVIATGFLSIFDAFSAGLPVIIPAFTQIKKDYAASIPDLDSYATVMYSTDGLQNRLADIVSGNESVSAKVQLAKEFVNGLSWDDVASKYIVAYRSSLQNHFGDEIPA
jgi:glycosyltransferase involved in cell wall biosynthesis